MELILRMRMGETAATIQNTSRANLELYHSALQNEYDENCCIATERGFDVVNQDFQLTVEFCESSQYEVRWI